VQAENIQPPSPLPLFDNSYPINIGVRLSTKTGTKLFVYNDFDKAAQVNCLEVIEIKTLNLD